MDIDPHNYNTVESFKSAVYDEHGVGSWIDDAKLSVVWHDAHGNSIPEHLKPLIKDD